MRRPGDGVGIPLCSPSAGLGFAARDGGFSSAPVDAEEERGFGSEAEVCELIGFGGGGSAAGGNIVVQFAGPVGWIAGIADRVGRAGFRGPCEGKDAGGGVEGMGDDGEGGGWN